MALRHYTESLEEVELGNLATWPYWLKLTASFLVGVSLIVGGYFLFYKPKIDRLHSAEKRETQLKEEFVRKQRLAANLPAHQEQMEEIQRRLRILLRQLPNQTQVPALLTDISQAGKERGLEFRRFKPLDAKQKDFYVELPIEINASGTYHQLASFVSDIANFQRVVTVGNIQMQRVNSGSTSDIDDDIDNVALSFSADLHTYHYDGSDDDADPQSQGRQAQ